MKVSITTKEESQGLIFKKPIFAVYVTVQFSEEEQAVIKTRKLKDYVVMERDWDAKKKKNAEAHPEYYNTVQPPHLFIKDLMRGTDTYHLDNPVEAKNYQAQLTERLKVLKNFLEGSKEVESSTSFEL